VGLTRIDFLSLDDDVVCKIAFYKDDEYAIDSHGVGGSHVDDTVWMPVHATEFNVNI